MGDCVRVGTWNVAWKRRGLKRATSVAETLAAPKCDVLCVTEVGDADLLPACGHVIDAGTDWGYALPKASPGRRKVMLWSKRPWTPVFDRLQDQLPGGRLVAGITETSVGKLTVVGVCIPWDGAHVNSGRRDRAPWRITWIGSVDSSDCPTQGHAGGRSFLATSTSGPREEANSTAHCRTPSGVSESQQLGSWTACRRLRRTSVRA